MCDKNGNIYNCDICQHHSREPVPLSVLVPIRLFYLSVGLFICHNIFSSEIDECEDDKLHECQGVASECENTAGSYRCVCDPGYTLQSDGRRCQGNATFTNIVNLRFGHG